MSISKIIDFINDTNARHLRLKELGSVTDAYSSAVMYRTSQEATEQYAYKDGTTRFGVANEAFYLIDYTAALQTRKQKEGCVYLKGTGDASGIHFAVEGGGKDENGYAQIRYARKLFKWNDIMPSIIKAFGIQVTDNSISKDAKDYVANMDMEKFYEGYVDEDGTVVPPYTVKHFSRPADNIYVNMCLNDNEYCSREGVVCFIDYLTSKIYIADDALTFAMNTLNDADAFDTDFDRQIRDDLEDGANVTLPGCAMTPLNNQGTLDQSEISRYIESVRGNRVITYQGGGWTSGNGSKAYGLINIVLSPNTFTGNWSGSSTYYFKENQLGTQYRICYYIDYNELPPYTMHIINNPSFVVPKEDKVLVAGHTPAFSNVPYTDPQTSFPYYNRRITFNNDGTINKMQYRGSSSSWYDDYFTCLGFNPVSEQIGTKPSDFTESVSENYQAWNATATQILMYKAPKIGETVVVGNLKEYKKLLNLAIGGETQNDVQNGTISDLSLLDIDEGSDKLDMEDDGSTIDGPDDIGIGSGFFHLYYTSAGVIQDVYTKALQNDDLGDLIAKFYAGDLGKAIIDVYRLPFICDSTDAQDIKLSNVTLQGVQGYEQHNRIHIIDFGDLKIENKFEDQRDYAPITRATIYLPFCGYQTIDIDDIMGATINLKCKVDKMSGKGIYEIKVKRDNLEAILYTFPMSCRLEYPVSYNQSRSLFSTALSAAGATAVLSSGGGVTVATNFGQSAHIGAETALGKKAVQTASVLGALNMTKPVTAKGGQIGDASGWLASMVPYIIINRPGYGEPEHFEEITGRAANTDVILGSIKGFTQIREMRLNGLDEATEEEKDNIMTTLRSGAIL